MMGISMWKVLIRITGTVKVGYEMISLYCPLGNKIQDDMYGIIEIQQDFQKLVKTLSARP